MKWQTIKLGELLSLCDAGTWGEEDPNGLPLLRSTNMQNGDLILDDLKKILLSQEKINQYTLLEGDILITKSSGSIDHIGKSLFINAEMGGKYGFSNFTQRLRPDKSQVLPMWIYYKVSDPATRDFLLEASQTTTGLRNLKISQLKELQIPLPPLEIQKEMVAKLDEKFAKLREAKKLREEALVDTEKILSQTLREIFDEGRQKGWEEVKIIDIANINPAKSEIKDFSDSTTISFIPMSSVDEYSQVIKEQEERKLGEVRSGYTYFKKGDIILAKVTPCMENGKIAISDNLKNEIGFGSSEFHVIRADKKLLNPKYLYQILRQKDFREIAVTKMTGTSGLKRVPKEFIENYKIRLPSLVEQEEIVSKLDDLSEKIKSLRELQKSQLEDIKLLEKAYLREAFSGELI